MGYNAPEVPDRYNLAAKTDKDGRGVEWSKFNQAERFTPTYTNTSTAETDKNMDRCAV